MTIIAAIIYKVDVFSCPADQKVYEKTTPAKIANPPSVGILDTCAFLSVGSSNKFLMTETLMMEGIAIKVMMKAVKQAKVTLSI
jgi:hypothetical protein